MLAIRRFFRYIAHIFRRILMDHGFLMAANLSYATLLTLVPFLIVIFYILSFFPFFHGLNQYIQQFIINNLISDLAIEVNQQVSLFFQQMGHLTTMNIVALGFLVLIMMSSMVDSFNKIWHVRAHYHFALSFLIYFIVLLLLPIIFSLLIVFTSYISSISVLEHKPLYLQARRYIYHVLPFLSSWVTFTLFNLFLPNTKVKVKHALFSGFVTAIIFELAKAVFRWYLGFALYKAIYGALATIPIFFTWIYCTWLIILIGGMLCNTLAVGLDRSVHYYDSLDAHLKKIS